MLLVKLDRQWLIFSILCSTREGIKMIQMIILHTPTHIRTHSCTHTHTSYTYKSDWENIPGASIAHPLEKCDLACSKRANTIGKKNFLTWKATCQPNKTMKTWYYIYSYLGKIKKYVSLKPSCRCLMIRVPPSSFSGKIGTKLKTNWGQWSCRCSAPGGILSHCWSGGNIFYHKAFTQCLSLFLVHSNSMY